MDIHKELTTVMYRSHTSTSCNVSSSDPNWTHPLCTDRGRGQQLAKQKQCDCKCTLAESVVYPL